ncbi:branched-chain amino acid ABC transporter permease [Thauera sp.]|jgi:branched-chain amino acid transport system permease protein|uniref:branched-chain amino acid ABC transporter permease n=1 Tax=Thauera sp. TaxID=1905334 RepID=UPI002BB91891|nr:branched-chain amino acid ABC transporter permease [Thauera sp.]HRO37565.1 branched-chain amino acid ABC transporter permease [Thauera sp.]
MPAVRAALPWLAVLLLALAWLGTDYALGKATLVATYAVAGLGVVVVVGQAGQIALGQAALVALGAYAQALLVARGVPAPLALPAAVAAGAIGGALASLPARRLGGLYFGMSTLAFALIVEEALARWESLTHGAAGLAVGAFAFAGWRADSTLAQAAVSVAALALALLACARLLASRHGRAWRAVRDDELAAAACGIDTDAAKMQAFVVGGALSGLAGGLYAHWIGFISPEQFGLVFSFELLMLAFIGGARRIAGAAWGALVIVAIPPLISVLRDRLPGDWARASGLELLLFGAVIVAVVLLRPAGLAGGGQGRER